MASHDEEQLSVAVCALRVSDPSLTAHEMHDVLCRLPALQGVALCTVKRELARCIATSTEDAVFASLPTLNDESLSMVFSLMPMSQLPACAATCSHWASIVRGDGLLWSTAFSHCFGGSIEPSEARRGCQRCMTAISQLEIRTVEMRASLTPRAGSAAGSLGPYVVITGGVTTGFEFTSHLDIWCPITHRVLAMAIEPQGDPLPERWQHSAVRWDDKLWLYGGLDRVRRNPCGCLHALYLPAGKGSLITSQSVLLRRCEEDSLVPNVEMPRLNWPTEGPALTGHVACVTGGEGGTGQHVRACMLCFGGKAPGGLITDLLWRVELFAGTELGGFRPPQTEWRLLKAAGQTPQPRYCHSAEMVSRGWLVFGGWATDQRARGENTAQLNQGTLFLSDLHALELPAMSWSELTVAGSVPRGRCQSVMLASADKELVLVFGGACHTDPEPGQT